MSNFKNEMADFIVSKNIIGISAGVCIGAVTKDAVASLVHDVLFPLLFIAINKFNLTKVTKIFSDKTDLNVLAFIKQFITWVIIVVVTIVFIQISFVYVLGVDKKALNNKLEIKKDVVI